MPEQHHFMQKAEDSSTELRKMIMGFLPAYLCCFCTWIADFLSSAPQHVHMIAKAVGKHPLAFYRLLRALASLGIFEEKENGYFGLTPLQNLFEPM